MTTNSELKNWKVTVEKEMLKLYSKKSQALLTKDSIAGAWSKNRNKIREYTKCKEVQTLKWNVESNETEIDSEEKIENNAKKKGGSADKMARLIKGSRVCTTSRFTYMPSPELLPNWTTWIPIQRNLMPEKEVPHNIPYFGDEVIEKEKNFIVSLEEEVNHVNLEAITDQKFLQLVEAVGKHKQDIGENKPSNSKSKIETQYFADTTKNPQLPKIIVFQAINATYPEFGSTERLIQRYNNLKKATKRENFAPDIDGPNPGDLPAEKSLHTFKSLLCRRCFLFDCPLHKDDPQVDAPIQRTKPRTLPDPQVPCSVACYHNNPYSVTVLSPRPQRSDNRKEKTDTTKHLFPERDRTLVSKYLNGSENLPDEWTNAEKSMYRALINNYPGQFCAVAKALATKSCEEVFRFSVQEGKTSRGERKKKEGKTSKFGKSQQAQLYKHTQDGTKENKSPYIPCHHEGDCSPENCTCRQKNNFCEKYCYCPMSCRDRFPGCRCKSSCKNRMCPCFLASRECDPDLCMNCLDGNLELNPETNSCQNVYLQRYKGKKIYVAESDIAGMGCFIGETAEKGDFIAEYVGEMITQEECESRGRVYDKSKMSYMFALNDEYILDAARFGGIIRFANHSSKPNCQSKILLVNGDHRIGIYAKQRIEFGDELFFDYGKDFVGHDLI